MSFDPRDAEAIRRRRAEAETLRAAKDGAPVKPSLRERWRAWRMQRHDERREAKVRSRENLKDYDQGPGPFSGAM
jgi:hypothetical protein